MTRLRCTTVPYVTEMIIHGQTLELLKNLRNCSAPTWLLRLLCCAPSRRGRVCLLRLIICVTACEMHRRNCPGSSPLREKTVVYPAIEGFVVIIAQLRLHPPFRRPVREPHTQLPANAIDFLDVDAKIAARLRVRSLRSLLCCSDRAGCHGAAVITTSGKP